ncbi:hypothetical protein DPMN_020930 [Dreissena polymorpha]|uniref:Uncharacterized protein n=1 Tax=Dreissena polymorpha TaxID=45954 RepID=A0A9D4NJV3_DREPO|nr:hypothetical protein DPMN_020930 [Dreissena polymorpha]
MFHEDSTETNKMSRVFQRFCYSHFKTTVSFPGGHVNVDDAQRTNDDGRRTTDKSQHKSSPLARCAQIRLSDVHYVTSLQVCGHLTHGAEYFELGLAVLYSGNRR